MCSPSLGATVVNGAALGLWKKRNDVTERKDLLGLTDGIQRNIWGRHTTKRPSTNIYRKKHPRLEGRIQICCGGVVVVFERVFGYWAINAPTVAPASLCICWRPCLFHCATDLAQCPPVHPLPPLPVRRPPPEGPSDVPRVGLRGFNPHGQAGGAPICPSQSSGRSDRGGRTEGSGSGQPCVPPAQELSVLVSTLATGGHLKKAFALFAKMKACHTARPHKCAPQIDRCLGTKRHALACLSRFWWSPDCCPLVPSPERPFQSSKILQSLVLSPREAGWKANADFMT